MSDAQAPDRRGISRRTGAILAQWAYVTATLVLFMLLTVGASQAHEVGGGRQIQPTMQSAVRIVAQQEVSSVAKVVVKNVSSAIGGGDDCDDGSCCPCPCCAGCSAVIAAEGLPLPFGGNLQRVAIPLARTRLPSAEFDALFRPPRRPA